jgi:hypothetical protein
MADGDQSPRSEVHVEATTDPCRAYNDPRLDAKRFLLAVMHDKDLPIRDRIRAASVLLRIYGEHEFEPPRLKYIIGGIPSEALGPCQSRPEMESTEKYSHFSEIAHKAPTRMTNQPGSSNIETIIEDIKSGNFPQPTRCTICGEYMPYPCSTSKTSIN